MAKGKHELIQRSWLPWAVVEGAVGRSGHYRGRHRQHHEFLPRRDLAVIKVNDIPNGTVLSTGDGEATQAG